MFNQGISFGQVPYNRIYVFVEGSHIPTLFSHAFIQTRGEAEAFLQPTTEGTNVYIRTDQEMDVYILAITGLIDLLEEEEE